MKVDDIAIKNDKRKRLTDEDMIIAELESKAIDNLFKEEDE